jgi:hypothetical protein
MTGPDRHLTRPRLDPKHCKQCAWLAQPDTLRWRHLHEMIAMLNDYRPSKLEDYQPPDEQEPA